MSIHFAREGFGNFFEAPKTFDEVTAHDEEHESELTLGELVLDTAAVMGAHKAPMNSSIGVLIYGVAKNSDQNSMHAMTGGIAHLFLDTCIEITFERLAHSLAAAGVDVLFLKPLAPISAVVPLVVGAHGVRIFRDAAICYLPSDPYVPLTMGDPEVACAVEEAKFFLNILSLPSYGLQRLHHYVSDRIVAGLHRVGITDQHVEMVVDVARFPIRTLGASMLGPGSNIPELLGRDRVTPLIPQGESRERLQRVFELVRPKSQAARYFRDVQIEDRPFRRPVASGVPTVAALSTDSLLSIDWGRMLGGGLDGGVPRILSGNQPFQRMAANGLQDSFLSVGERVDAIVTMRRGRFGESLIDTIAAEALTVGLKGIRAAVMPFSLSRGISSANRTNYLGPVRPKSSELVSGDTHQEDIPEAPQVTPSLAARYFQHARVDIKSQKISIVSHKEGDRVTAALNRMSIEEQAAREFEREIGEFCGYLRGQAESEDRARDRVRLQGALSDAALAARRFGALRLGALFQAGHEMIRLEESIRGAQGVGNFRSMEGALAIGSVVGTGMALIGAFAVLDREPEDVFGPLVQGMREHSASLCSQVQEICRQVAYFHAETMWEFGRVKNELFSMYEELKAVQMQVTKEAEFLKQDVAIGFLRVQGELDLFRKEIGYQVHELRLEELRQVEDGINHYEFGTVSLDKVRGWASVIERWMANPPFKKMIVGRTIGFLAEAAKAKGVVEIEEASMDAIINLDTLEALIPAYVAVLKMLREIGVAYDSEGVLWQKIVRDPVNACEAVFNKLEEKRTQIETAFADNAELLHAFREHFTSYKAQIARIRRSAQAKKKEIKAMPCVMRSAEKFSRATAKLDESEGLLTDKLQALIVALALRK